ncbi:MAG: phage tail tape measure protein [Desulfobacteraceae bacterium]|nr:phage tail tape measure protein [Desulfobacteraceae bacterium]
MSLSSVAIQFTIIDLLSKGVDHIRDRMAALAKGNKDVQNSFDRMTRAAKYAAVAGVATRELYRGLKPAIGAAGDLQAEMLGTRAELAGSVKSAQELEAGLKKIKSTAFEVQAWTPFDQTQITALEKQLIKSGATVEQVTGKAGAAAAAAALGTYENLDPVQMGKNLIGIATPFKIQSDQFMKLADEVSRASSASVVGAAEIAETAKYAAPAMAQLGRSTHEMLVLSAMLAQRGVDASMAGTGLRQFFNAAAKHKIFRDAAGGMKSLAEITQILNERLGKLGEAEKLEVLTKIFDMRGAPVAMALMDAGAASFGQIETNMRNALPLSEKLNIQMQGLNKQWESLRGTSRSTLAMLYQPALAPLTALVVKMNDFVYAIGEATQNSDALSKAVSGLSLGGVTAGALATIGLGAGALYYGRQALKGVGGIKGLLSNISATATGVAAGKAVEAATGVRPVFVTNWPANFSGSGMDAATFAEKYGWTLGMLGRAGVAGAAVYGFNWSMEQAGLHNSTLQSIPENYNRFADAWGHMMEVMRGERDWNTGQLKRPITINNQISIDQGGRATTQTDNMNTTVNTAINRGWMAP